MEVHVHGNAFLCKGVRLPQVEQALRPWLDYLDVDTVAEAASLEQFLRIGRLWRSALQLLSRFGRNYRQFL